MNPKAKGACTEKPKLSIFGFTQGRGSLRKVIAVANSPAFLLPDNKYSLIYLDPPNRAQSFDKGTVA